METYRYKERVQAEQVNFDGKLNSGEPFKKGDWIVHKPNGDIVVIEDKDFKKSFERDIPNAYIPRKQLEDPPVILPGDPPYYPKTPEEWPRPYIWC